jgi:hypothetical protein
VAGCDKEFKKRKPYYVYKQQLEDIMFKCDYCNVTFRNADFASHADSCAGLNYKCPNEGCGHAKQMPTIDHLR